MAYVYKKFTAQDYAIVPFNAHKQYNFTSASAASNQVTYFDARWTSESIDFYSGNSGSDDTINNIKYNQLDHLFYRNYKRNISNRFGNSPNIKYLNHKRELHENVNILSVPAGLYGYEIKPETFRLNTSSSKSSRNFVVDDGKGNLIISGTNVSDYPTDPKSQLLSVGPLRGFEYYDLNITNGYLSFDGYNSSAVHRDGKRRTNPISSYSTPDFGDEFDDSYYYNIIKYRKVNFNSKYLHRASFPTIEFNGTTSELKLPHNEKFNFNNEDTFAISFWCDVRGEFRFSGSKNDGLFTETPINFVTTQTASGIQTTATQSINDSTSFNTDGTGTGLEFKVVTFSGSYTPSEIRITSPGRGYKPGDLITVKSSSLLASSSGLDLIFQLTDESFGNSGIIDGEYLISKSTTKTVVSSPSEGTAGIFSTQTSGALQPKDTFAEPQFPFEIFVKEQNDTHVLFFKRSDGTITSTTSASFTTGSKMQHVVCQSTGTEVELYINGILQHNSTDVTTQTQNTANIYIGNKGGNLNPLSGSLSQINIYNNSLTATQISNLHSSSNGSPYVGNIFYQNGFSTITHPRYQDTLGKNGVLNYEASLTQSLDPAVTASDSTDVFMNNDGTKLYAIDPVGFTTQKIVEWNLSTAYDISTAVFVAREDISEESAAVSGHWKPDGSVLFIGDQNGKKVYAYDASTPFDITTLSYQGNDTGRFSVNYLLRGIHFDPSGKHLYICQSSTGKIHYYRLQTPFNLSKVYFQGTFDISDFTVKNSSTSEHIHGLYIVDEGYTMYLSDNNAQRGPAGIDQVYKFYLNVPYDILSANYVESYSLSDGGADDDLSVSGIYAAKNKIYVADNGTSNLHQYDISSNDSIINDLNFQGSHLIYENEYQCTVDEFEFNDTLNISARKIKSKNSQDMADFATGSLFKPYVTTIGLYNEENELLVVGKLGQPIRVSDETDTTFVVRWDS